ncbi:hypothetical protein HanOQP8_Chr01g0002031 [Helianthus annuus]|nr:hypothetical protein HanOQP8_Chr01g0002031 [Helianthus annuus]
MNGVSIGVSRVILNPKLKKKSNKSTIAGISLSYLYNCVLHVQLCYVLFSL